MGLKLSSCVYDIMRNNDCAAIFLDTCLPTVSGFQASGGALPSADIA